MSQLCRVIGVCLLVVAVGCGGGGAATPEAAFKDFQAAAKAKDADKMWGLMSKETQGQFDMIAGLMKGMLGAFDKLAGAELKAAEEAMQKESGMSLAELKS